MNTADRNPADAATKVPTNAAARAPEAATTKMPRGAADGNQILLAHGSGGAMMHRLIEDLFLDAYGSDILACADDAATLVAPTDGASLAFSTDSFVVTPHFFPGGDIGRLAVCGTVNDVATSGAHVRWLSIAFVLEEGFALDDLRRICASIAEAAREAEVQIVTGDTKVVNRGHGDGVYLNTSGIGVVPAGRELSGTRCSPGDRVLLSGTLGDHGIAIISCRENLSFSTTIESDVAPLNHLIAAVLDAAPQVRCFRDPTRGGLASTLNELAAQSGTVMTIDEDAVPIRDQVRGACDLLGYDVLQVANEGKMVCVVPASEADAALSAMRASRYGANAAIIGEVSAPGPGDNGPRAYVRTAFGSRRILDMLVGEQLPRIC
jgi:hydrogenase expression/formation protein HypE